LVAGIVAPDRAAVRPRRHASLAALIAIGQNQLIVENGATARCSD